MSNATNWLCRLFRPASWSLVIALCWICVGVLLTSTRPASAVFCTLSAPSVSFGAINTSNGQNYGVPTSYGVNCSSGSANESMIACLYDWGSSNGGGGVNGPWYMKNGSTILNYNIYADSAYSQVLGLGSFVYSTFTLNSSGIGSTTLTLYFQVPSGQSTVAPGSYTNSTTLLLKLGDLATLTTSCNGGVTTQQINSSSAVSATVQGTCTVTGGTLNFGSVGLLSANVDATATVTPNCSSGTSYTVSLDGGQNGGTSATNRRMLNGAASVTYGLFTDSGRSNGWYGATVSGTGNGSNQPITVYGRVAPQATPAPATYTDTVVVTVTF
jgi:spore coat protein U-like protein